MKRFAISIFAVQLLASAAFAQPAYGPQQSVADSNADEDVDGVVQSISTQLKIHKAGDVFTLDDDRSESSPESPPLETEDAGTPGNHGVEVSFITDCRLGSLRGRACLSGIDANIGIGDRVELNVSKSATADKLAGMRTQMGRSPTEVGVKWRFLDRDGWQAATYPSFEFDDATQIRGIDGALQDSEGRSIYLPVILSRDIGQVLTVVTNIGYRANLDHPNNNSVFTSVAVGRAFGRNSQGMIEIASEKERASPRRTTVRVGWIKVLFPKSRSRYRVSLSTSIGRSIGETESGAAETTLFFGITLSRRPH